MQCGTEPAPRALWALHLSSGCKTVSELTPPNFTSRVTRSMVFLRLPPPPPLSCPPFLVPLSFPAPSLLGDTKVAVYPCRRFTHVHVRRVGGRGRRAIAAPLCLHAHLSDALGGATGTSRSGCGRSGVVPPTRRQYVAHCRGSPSHSPWAMTHCRGAPGAPVRIVAHGVLPVRCARTPTRCATGTTLRGHVECVLDASNAAVVL